MAIVSFPKNAKLPQGSGMFRSLIRYGVGKWELKITIDEPREIHGNMLIGLRATDMDTLLASLKAEGLIANYSYPERTR